MSKLICSLWLLLLSVLTALSLPTGIVEVPICSGHCPQSIVVLSFKCDGWSEGISVYDGAEVRTVNERGSQSVSSRTLFAKFAEFLAAEGAGSEAPGFLGSKNFELGNAVQAGDDVMVQGVRNTPTTINDIDYSGHALDQMQNHGVMPSVVENTINVGQQFPTRAGTVGYFDSVNNVRVIVNSQNGTVVTVIRGAP